MRLGRWLREHPRFLERTFQLHHWAFLRARRALARIGFERVDRWIRGPEEFGKRLVFDCRMCGQCILHSTGMTCPMTCPKNLRNGPCGGVRANGHCEVLPEMRCIWVEAYERSQRMPLYGAEIRLIQAPLNRQLEGSSAWIAMLAGRTDPPRGWSDPSAERDA
jgi:hypothetical protein